ncbi:pyridoxamine kinase [uncultured Sphaerochaeta sp.]|uniref:pyridoxamine kinase n=1 Tax=uncultured Sphaerochaeta sp. TaxID=886478 RepID=UPI002A0A2AA5|nr:pyridoxamine kinase [uncultured Sphaerochaeta sp.]
MVPTCVAIHDLCSYSKSSLSVVIPTLEALGVEVCPLVSSLLSSQTDGFDSYYFEDKTETLEKILTVWESLDLSFDSIYSGFLGSCHQIQIIENLIARQKKKGQVLVVVDPVLGDEGTMYGPVDVSLVEHMRMLITHSDVITPNTTEAALLLNRPYQSIFTQDEIYRWARELAMLGPSRVLVTSVRLVDSLAVAYCDEGTCGLVPYKELKASYPGSGDLFASLLTGLLVNKVPFLTAVSRAVDLCSLALQRTAQEGYERRHGVAPLLIIPDIVKERMLYVR